MHGAWTEPAQRTEPLAPTAQQVMHVWLQSGSSMSLMVAVMPTPAAGAFSSTASPRRVELGKQPKDLVKGRQHRRLVSGDLRGKGAQ